MSNFASSVPQIVMKGPSETKLLKKLLHYVIMGDILET